MDHRSSDLPKDADAILGRRPLLLGLGAASFMSGFLTGPANAQSAGAIARAIFGNSSTSNNRAPLTQADADGGIRALLQQGALAAVTRLGRTDGFWGDGLVRIPLPDSLGRLQRQLARARLSGPLDDLQLKINRGAETAVPMGLDLFKSAITSITLTDAIGLVRGGPTSGTDYLKSRTYAPLSSLFVPPMTSAFDSSGAGRSLEQVDRRYGRQLGTYGDLGGSNLPANATLKDRFVAYAVGKSLDGLFHYIGTEEQAIRQDPAKRTTELLRTIFGQ